MDSELRRLQREFDASLTPTQRKLVMVDALTQQMCTPYQIEIMSRMEPHTAYMDGMTIEQVKRLALIDVMAEAREKGQADGKRDVTRMIVIFVIGLIVFGFIALVR
jgi:hypothetical protein